MTGSVVRDFAVFLGYCVVGYLGLVAIIWVFEQLPTWAYLTIGLAGGGFIVWRLGPDHEDELKLGDDGHLHSAFFNSRFRR